MYNVGFFLLNYKYRLLINTYRGCSYFKYHIIFHVLKKNWIEMKKKSIFYLKDIYYFYFLVIYANATTKKKEP